MRKRILMLIFLSMFTMPLIFQKMVNVEAQDTPARSTATFNPIADTFIYSGDPDVNYGDESYLQISYNDPHQEVALVKFDLSSLPSDAVIIDATMWLHFQGTTLNGDSSVGVYLLTSSWDESSITWNSALSLTASPTGITVVIDDDLYADWKSFGLLKDYTQTWHDNPSSNYGLMIRPITTGGDFWRRFSSREENFDDYDPYLEVTYYQESIYHELSGRVYQGDAGVEYSSSPIEDVRLDLYCSTSPGILGTLIDTTTTDSEGWYGLKGYYGCDYYNIVEVDPIGYISDGATTVDGVVINANQIQYMGNLSDQWKLGNKFWDKPVYYGFLPMIKK